LDSARTSIRPGTQQADVLIICVHFRTPAETERFVTTALRQKTRSSVRIVVVDNSPETDAVAVPVSLREAANTTVITAEANSGYFGAAAIALKEHLVSHPTPSWVIISNPDIRFPSDEFIERLCELHSGEELGVLAPTIRSTSSATDYNPYLQHRPGRTRMHFYRWVFGTYPTHTFYQAISWAKQRVLHRSAPDIEPRPLFASNGHAAALQPQAIYAPHGSFIALSRTYFERGGTLDHGAFLFGEEIFVAETARKLGLTVLYDPRLELEHVGHISMGGLWNRATARYRRDASRYLADQFF
jgi:GT2 family glycosyltransferase